MSLDIYLTIPLKIDRYDPIEMFSINITHNLGKMAKKAGLYRAMWHPEEIGITKAGDMIEWLKPGLAGLKSKTYSTPSRAKPATPANQQYSSA